MIPVIPDHIADALKRLLSQYKNKDLLEKLVRALLAPAQDIETTIDQLNTLRGIYTAVGVNLDNLGKILGLKRPPGDDDDTYRNKLLAQVKINTSQGQPEFVIQTFQLFTGATQIILDEQFTAEILVESEHVFPTQDDVDLVLGILEKVLPAGVRANGFIEFDATNAFSFDGPLSGQGFGSVFNPTQGGKLSRIRRIGGFFQCAGTDPKGKGFSSTHDPLVGGRWVSSL